MENECEALPGVAYPGVWDNRSTLNTKTGYDDDVGEEANAYVHSLLVYVYVYVKRLCVGVYVFWVVS